nr:PREDICTED: uncharacterized protein LOC108953352 [Musa acuminata subsp. malaccensis]
MGQQITDSKTRRELVGAGGRNPAPAVAVEQAEARKRVNHAAVVLPPRGQSKPSLLSPASRSSHGATGPHPHHHLRHLLTRRQRPAFPLSLYTSPHLVVCGLFSCVVALSSGTIPEQCHPHGWRLSAPLTSAGDNMVPISLTDC